MNPKATISIEVCEDDDIDYGRDHPPLLNDNESPMVNNLSSNIFHKVQSYSSFYTDFYPPDLTRFNTDKYRNENSQPLCMTSAWRVVSFFIVVFFLPTLLISVPLYARYHLYNARTYSFTDGDMRSFHNDVSSFWCQGQRVTSNGTFEAFLTKEPRRLKKRSRTSSLSSELLLQRDDIEEWGLFLIKGSLFAFSVCSRWPGGTLLVVKGEENLRRCFYREERLEDELNNEPTRKVDSPPQNLIVLKTENTDIDDDDDDGGQGGGEVFDEDELSKQDLIRRLYLSNANHSMKSANPSIEKVKPNMTFTSTSNLTELNQDEIEDEKISKKKKKNKKNKDKKHKIKKLKQKIQNELNVENGGGVSAATNEALKEAMKNGVKSKSKMEVETLKVNKGLFTFNINETLDITTGNSSYSSSEEFMSQCSDTIVSIELTPYQDCKERASISDEGPDNWRFMVNESDFYYFIFTSDNSIEANIISFRLRTERKLLDVSEPMEKCANKSECVFPFSFLKSSGVIVDFNERYENISKLEDLNNYHLVSICQPRSVVYTVFILLVPFIIIMFAFR